ncbi:MAG: arginine deiminase [Candidatus Izemoplasmataceae bacterium]
MINVYSEIGKLKTVLLHRPGRELENLTPKLLDKLLFDDIPFLDIAQEEHDAFAETLRKEGVEVLYLTDMVSETLDGLEKDDGEAFIRQFIQESGVKTKSAVKAIYDYLESMDTKDMVEKMISGIKKSELPDHCGETIMEMLESEYPFYTDPMPNILFQRDPFSSIGTGVAINRMYTSTRRRETLFSNLILKHHPRFRQPPLKAYYERTFEHSIEGGDVLVLSENILAIGISMRTDPNAIEELARTLFDQEETFSTILAFNIPSSRAFMHLDTVFTQVDEGLFTVHSDVFKKMTIFEITKAQEGSIHIEKVVSTIESVLEKHLDRNVELISCGGNDIVDSEREQWNDGANTLAIEPGKVIAYSRNHVTNRLLREKGVTVLEIPSSELSRGRGGPRCMSMPIYREKKGETS